MPYSTKSSLFRNQDLGTFSVPPSSLLLPHSEYEYEYDEYVLIPRSISESLDARDRDGIATLGPARVRPRVHQPSARQGDRGESLSFGRRARGETCHP